MTKEIEKQSEQPKKESLPEEVAAMRKKRLYEERLKKAK